MSRVSVAEGEPAEEPRAKNPPPQPNRLIYGDFERLVAIDVMGRRFEVPEGIPLIRAFQYIQFELNRMSCDWSRFCFNDTIGCCLFEFRLPDQEPVLGRACCQRVVEGLQVLALPKSSVLFDEQGRALP